MTNRQPDLLDELIAARRLRLTMAGVDLPARTSMRPLEVVRRPVGLVRSAEKQDEIDALERGALARRYA